MEPQHRSHRLDERATIRAAMRHKREYGARAVLYLVAECGMMVEAKHAERDLRMVRRWDATTCKQCRMLAGFIVVKDTLEGVLDGSL